MRQADRGGIKRSNTRWPRAIVIGQVLALFALTGCASALTTNAAGQKQVGVALILKTLTNPYFVSMKQAAQAQAKKDNVRLSVAAGTADGDTQAQINAIDTAIARGDKGILITSNGDSVNAALRQAKSFGLFVIALDTPLNPAETANITYATDNEAAGRLVGRYAAAKLAGKKAVIAMLDLYNNQIVSVDVERDHGFLEGMGINPRSKTENAKEAKSGTYAGGGAYQVVCHQPTQGAVDGGRTAMEQCLSANGKINVVYTINEPAARGAYAALKAAGREKKVVLVTIDGSCEGMQNVKSGEFNADSTQYPAKMAALGVSSVARLARGGEKPSVTSGKSFLDTGTALVAHDKVAGVASQTPARAATRCWGSPAG